MDAQVEVTQGVTLKSNSVPENDTNIQETVSTSLPMMTPKCKLKREDTELAASVQQANEALLEKLHIKFATKPWSETLRLVHHCMDKPIKRVLTDCPNHPILKCKDRLEGCVKAKSLSDVMNRLEAIAQEKGLETHIGPGGNVCYITSEMFYIEVQVKRNGNVYFVKVAHHGETPQESEDLLQILRAKDFEAFGTHLQGLLKLHEVQGDGDTKAKVYHALQCLENYLYTEFNMERMNKNKMDLILYGKVGYITPRRGGIPMTTEFFVCPYDCTEEVHNSGTCKVVTKASVSIYGTINQYSLLFPRLINKLEEEKWDSSSVHPIHRDLVNLELPACFIMTFAEPVVLITSFIHKIQDITRFPLFASDNDQIHEILIRKNFQGSRTDTGSKRLRFIKSLPDCMDQCYHIHSSQADYKTGGAQVRRINFAESRHVSLILEILRCQAVFTTLICSCLSDNIHTHGKYRIYVESYRPDLLYFEVCVLPRAMICVSFQHPTGFSLCSVYISIVSSMELRCKSYLHKSDPPLPCSDELLTKILTRCMSIPITMRTIFKKAQEKVAQDITPTNEQLAPQTSQEVPKSVTSGSEQEQTLEVKPALTPNTNDETSLITDHDIDTDLIQDSPLDTESDSHKLCSSIVQETSFSITQDDCSEMGQHESTAVENTSVNITEEQRSMVEACSPVMSTEHSHSIIEGPSEAQETSFPTSEDTNSSILEKLNSRFMEDLSSSVPDDLNNTKDDVR